MDQRHTRNATERELEALLRTCEAAGLLESRVIDGEVKYRITEFGLALPPHAWLALVAPDVRRH